MRPIRQGHPDRVNYHTPYPIAEGVWDYFAQNVVGAVDVRVQAAPSARAKQPAFDPVASVDLVLADGFQIEEAAFGGLALLAHNDANADEGGFVLKHLHEAGMWHKDKVLVGSLPQANRLLPVGILAYDQGADALFHQPLHDTATGDVQIGGDLSRSFVGQDVELARGIDAFRKFGLQLGAAFVVPLVERLQRTALNQKRHDAGLIGSYRCKSVQSNVNAHRARRVHLSGDYEALIEHLQGVVRGVRCEACGTIRTCSIAAWRVSTRMANPDGTTEPRFRGARLIAWSV